MAVGVAINGFGRTGRGLFREKPPLEMGSAMRALGRCAARTGVLLYRRRIHQPPNRLGIRLHFADGTTSAVYRETVIDRPPPHAPAVLVVGFRLRVVHSEWAHALFRMESELNTLLFAGFPGLVSKLWCRHDERDVYRGVYQWDDPTLAEAYVRALWWVLSLVSVPGSIHYAVLPGLRRDEMLDNPKIAGRVAPEEANAWWRLMEVERASA